VCGNSINNVYICFQHVSGPHDTGKHFYIDTNSAIYWLRAVGMVIHTRELISPSHGDDVDAMKSQSWRLNSRKTIY